MLKCKHLLAEVNKTPAPIRNETVVIFICFDFGNEYEHTHTCLNWINKKRNNEWAKFTGEKYSRIGTSEENDALKHTGGYI